VSGYPLETLRGLRADEEEAAQRALADAVRAHAEASSATARAREARDLHQDETRALLARELDRPLDLTRPSDATTLAAWRRRRKLELEALEGSVARALDAERARERDVEAARDALATARREREAIEKHFARWREDARRRAEAREEAESEDRRSRS
jgi:flagellar biosynthesis chaperone FliJ